MSTSVPALHPAVVLRSHYRRLRSLLAVALVAIVGLTTTVVVLAGDDDPVTSTSSISQPAARLGDPFQGRTQPTRDTGKPDESAVAAAISGGSSLVSPLASRPDESRIAATIGSQQPQTAVSAPDEAKIAASLAEHEDTGPVARARAYQQQLNQMSPDEIAGAYGSK